MKKLMLQFQGLRSGQFFPAALVVLGLAGCGGNETRVYEVAKETSAAGKHEHAAAAVNHAQAQPQLTWTLPAGWEEAPRGELRLASFRINGQNSKQADVSVIALSGTVGGNLNNVNRWRGQVGLPPVPADELPKLSEKVDVGGFEGELFDLNGTAASGDATRVLATILHREGGVWFFKVTGDDELVANQKPAFVEFLKSLKFGVASDARVELPAGHPPLSEAASALPQGHPPVTETASALPQGHPPLAEATSDLPQDHASCCGATVAPQSATDSSPKPQWKVPANWKEETATQMLIAKFSVGPKTGRAEITVSSFPGDVGGLLANVNRWRSQIALSPIDAALLPNAVKNLKMPSATASLVELENPDGKSPGLVGVSLPHTGQTWFFKMIGDAKTVAGEKDAFIKFVQSVKLPNAS